MKALGGSPRARGLWVTLVAAGLSASAIADEDGARFVRDVVAPVFDSAMPGMGAVLRDAAAARAGGDPDRGARPAEPSPTGPDGAKAPSSGGAPPGAGAMPRDGDPAATSQLAAAASTPQRMGAASTPQATGAPGSSDRIAREIDKPTGQVISDFARQLEEDRKKNAVEGDGPSRHQEGEGTADDAAREGRRGASPLFRPSGSRAAASVAVEPRGAASAGGVATDGGFVGLGGRATRGPSRRADRLAETPGGNRRSTSDPAGESATSGARTANGGVGRVLPRDLQRNLTLMDQLVAAAPKGAATPRPDGKPPAQRAAGADEASDAAPTSAGSWIERVADRLGIFPDWLGAGARRDRAHSPARTRKAGAGSRPSARSGELVEDAELRLPSDDREPADLPSGGTLASLGSARGSLLLLGLLLCYVARRARQSAGRRGP